MGRVVGADPGDGTTTASRPLRVALYTPAWPQGALPNGIVTYVAHVAPALRARGIEVFVMAMDNAETNTKAVRLVRRMYPNAKVFARARDRQHAWRLMDLGATVFREMFGSSMQMGEQVLVALGMPPDKAADHAARFSEHDNKLLRAQHLVYDDDVALRQTSRESRKELMELFAADSSGADDPAQAPLPQPPGK